MYVRASGGVRAAPALFRAYGTAAKSKVPGSLISYISQAAYTVLGTLKIL